MFRKIFRNTVEKTLLGRWARTTEKVNSIKVYWANMDHCGTCGKELVYKDSKKNHTLTDQTNKPRAV